LQSNGNSHSSSETVPPSQLLERLYLKGLLLEKFSSGYGVQYDNPMDGPDNGGCDDCIKPVEFNIPTPVDELAEKAVVRIYSM